MKVKNLTAAVVLTLLCRTLTAAVIWVSPAGSDSAAGTQTEPKATVTAALRAARELRRTGKISENETVTIRLTGGVHRLYEPIFIRPEDSGTPQSPTVIECEEGSSLSGGVTVGGWRKEGKFWVADAPAFNGRPLDFRQMYVDGVKADRARDVDDFEHMNRIISVDERTQALVVPAEAVRRIAKASYAEMVLHEMWCTANLRIREIEFSGDEARVRFHNPESRIQFEHPWPRPMVTDDGRNSAFYLTNALELLDRAGEWYHDIERRKIYYLPREGEDMRTAEVTVPAVETLVEVRGWSDDRVHDIVFRDVAFEYTTWMRPSTHGHVPLQAGMYMTDGYRIDPQMVRPDGNHKLDNQGWLGRAAAAVTVEFADAVDFEKCTFAHLGGAGLDYVFATEGGRVNRCTFRDIAGNGLVVGSFSPAGLETHRPYDPTDGREVCRGLTVEDSLFTETGTEDWGCVGICAGYVAGVSIVHNEICEVPYTGISLGWGWTRTVNCMRDNKVHANLIHHYAKHMYDTAGIYTLGAQPGTSVTENAVHTIYTPSYAHDPEHWFYLYSDEGSSYMEFRDNWTDDEKYLQNANGPCMIWDNNGPSVSREILLRAGIRN